MQKLKTKFQLQGLITPYAVVAILFIILFQVYWLHTTYLNEEKIIIDQAQNILKEQVLNKDASSLLSGNSENITVSKSKDYLVKSIDIELKIYGKDDKELSDNATKKMVDSLITASGLLNTNPDILKKLNTSLESVFPGLKHHISAVIKGKNVYYPYASQLDDNNGKAITIRSQLNPADLYTISFINLGQFILYKLTISIMLSLIYIGVCISSLLLLINNIKKNKKLMVQKDNFTNNMAHELKTPIATLHAAAEALSTYNFIDDKVLAREYIEIMKGDLKRLENMAESILLNSRVKNGKINLLPEPIEVRKIIDTIVTSFVPRIVSENAIVEVNGGNNIYINGDTEHLKNVFINLLDNSLKYAADNVKVVFKIEKTDNVVSILISDNGIGIAPEHQLDIFIPYYRVSEGDRHSVKGFGLGLSYAKEIIRLHNGSIKLVASTPHSGSEFEIILPAL